ncbi:MAG: endonuclease III [Nanoarchaeota archaeon]
MKTKISEIMNLLKNRFNHERKTTLNRMREEKDPFKILIGCLVSINIKDEVTEKILNELFSKVNSFNDILNMNTQELEKILYLARYRKVKASTLKSVSKEILERFNGEVPNNKLDLLSIKGIGNKTANVVLNFAFNKSFIPVDSNTIRISNRLGWSNTKKPEEVEKFLVENLNEDFLKEANALFMLHGKKICVPVSPFCSQCPIENHCMKVEVEKSR